MAKKAASDYIISISDSMLNEITFALEYSNVPISQSMSSVLISIIALR
jgi:hypothetical protein